SDLPANVCEQLCLELHDPFFSAEHFLFPIAQLGCREAFRIRECLTPLVLGWYARGIRLRDLDEVSKDAIETNAQVVYATARTFAGFERRDDLFSVATGRAQLIELGGVTFTNCVAVAELDRRVVVDC